MNLIFCEKFFLKEVATDIICTPFLTKEFTDTIVNILENNTVWTRNTGDKNYSTQDFFFSKTEEYKDIHFLIEDAIQERIVPILYEIWSFDELNITQLFAVKYSLTTQKSLAIHNDDSFITMSIKLNNDYDGGVLEFPRQSFTNKEVSPGDLLIWPSRLTHPHRSTELTSGEKYSITIWTEEILTKDLVYKK